MHSGSSNLSVNRYDARILITCADRNLSGSLRQMLHSLGFGKVRTATNHILGIEAIHGEAFDYVLFDARPSNMPPEQFVRQVVKMRPSAMVIALSNNASVDDVFDLLKCGARGLLKFPLCADQVEQTLVRAAESAPLNRTIFESDDRDAALAGMVLNGLRRVCTSLHRVRYNADCIRDVAKCKRALTESMQLARTLSEGGDSVLVDKIAESCCLSASGGRTRLGRVRVRLSQQRRTPSAA